MMKIQSLNHSGLLVTDLEKSCWFYGTVLNMEAVPRPKTFKFPGAWFRSGSCEIHLLAVDALDTAGFGNSPVADRPDFATHLAFQVERVDDVAAALNEYNVEIKIGPLARGDGMVQIFVDDPDGYRLEFYSWVEGSARDAVDRESFILRLTQGG